MKTILTVLSVSLLTTACIKEIPLDKSSFEPELVINSLFTPDSVFVVYVHQTIPFDADNWQPILDARVEIRQKGQSGVILLTHEAGGRYEADNVRPRIGEVYTLFVEAGELGSATAIDTVPLFPVVTASEYQIGATFDQYGDAHTDIAFTFLNDTSHRLYWELLVVAGHSDYQGGSSMSIYLEPFIADPLISAEGYLDFYPKSFPFSNRHIDSTSYTLNLKMNPIVYSIESPGPTPFPSGFGEKAIILRATSQAYYQYKKAWTIHKDHQLTGDRVSDPLRLLFSGQPTRLYSNVNEAHGIFAAYTTTIKELKEK